MAMQWFVLVLVVQSFKISPIVLPYKYLFSRRREFLHILMQQQKKQHYKFIIIVVLNYCIWDSSSQVIHLAFINQHKIKFSMYKNTPSTIRITYIHNKLHILFIQTQDAHPRNNILLFYMVKYKCGCLQAWQLRIVILCNAIYLTNLKLSGSFYSFLCIITSHHHLRHFIFFHSFAKVCFVWFDSIIIKMRMRMRITQVNLDFYFIYKSCFIVFSAIELLQYVKMMCTCRKLPQI